MLIGESTTPSFTSHRGFLFIGSETTKSQVKQTISVMRICEVNVFRL